MSPWMVGLSLYSVVSMTIMFFMIRHSKFASISIMDFDLKVEIACAILVAPILMPIILLMLMMYSFVGTDNEHRDADMGMYFQSALVLVVFVSLSVMTVVFPVRDTEHNDRQPAQTVCECKK